MRKILGFMLSSLIFQIPFLGSALAEVNRGNYPAHWWQEVPRDQAPEWEVLPQDAGPGEVILSKRNELGILSNFAATPIEMDQVKYASIEGLWQSLKYPESADDERAKDPNVKWEFTREQVRNMVAFEAKNAGNLANANMKKLGIQWVTYQGKKINYLEPAMGEFYQLIYKAMSLKLQQNPEVKRILTLTGDLVLRPDHKQGPGSAPAWHYHEIWMKLRKEQLN